MSRQRNAGCVFTGLVGSSSRPAVPKGYSRSFGRRLLRTLDDGGPLGPGSIWVTPGVIGTLPLVVRGQAGYYLGGQWFATRAAA